MTVSFMSFIKMLNSRGLRRLPCGTPHRTVDQLEHLLLHITLCLRPCRYDLKVSVKENEVPTEKNSSRASIFATKASYISN